MSDKFVDFHKFCPQCVNQDLKEWEEPCNECLTTPVNQDSHKPVMFKAKEEEEQ